MNGLQQFLNETIPLRYATVYSLGVREDGNVCLLGGVAAYNAEGEQVAVVSGFDCDHRRLEELAEWYGTLRPRADELAALTLGQLEGSLCLQKQ